jgi:flagellar hook-associated protein 3 FlgL
VKVAINAGQQVAETWNGQAILKGSASTDVLTTLDNLATAVRNGDQPGISQGLTDLQAAFDRATTAQNALGTDENSVSDATARLATLRLATDARRSKDEDTNMAEAISRMNQAQTAYRAALGAVAQTGQLSLFDYMR